MGALTHTVKGSIASFRSADKAPIESLKFHFLPKQATGTPSPESPIPIEGWTGLNGRRAGKNLIKPYYTEPTTYYGIPITPTANGVRVTGTAVVECAIRLSSMDVRFLDEGKKYTFSLYVNGDISGCKDPYIGYFDGVSYWGTMCSLTQENNYKFTWTVPYRYATAIAPWFDMYIRIREGSTVDFEIGLQMEEGSNATGYEPYSEEQIPITFPNGETIYGGYVDPVAGEIVATFKKINLKNKAWYYYTSNQFALNMNKKLLSDKVFCDMLPISKINGYPTDDKSIGFWGNGASYAYIIFIKYEASSDINDFKAWLNSLEYDPCLIYELATPIHIPIPAEDMNVFLDHNNFWSDANDDTEVEYCFTDRLSERKLIMDTPHIESASDSIVSFSTDMKAPIVDLKAYFTPVQEGSGDPSPANVRPIKGRTKAEVINNKKNFAKLSQEILNADRTQADITFHALSDSSVHIEGTATGDAFLTNGYFQGSKWLRLLKAGTYTLTSNFPNSIASGSVVYMYGYDVDGNNLGTFAQAYDTKDKTVFTLQKDSYVNIQMIVKSGATINHDVWVQIEKGSSKTAYEQHYDEVVPITFPATKNLFKCIESEVINVGWNRYIPNPIKQAGTYTISCTYDGDFGGAGSKGVAFVFADSDKQKVGNYICGYEFGTGSSRKQTFTVTSEQAQAPYIGIWPNSNGLAYSDIVNAIQIETGSYATGFEPYGTAYGGYIDLIRGKFVLEYYRGLVKSAAGKQGNFFYNVTSNIGMPAIADTNAGMHADRFPNNPNTADVGVDQSITIYHNQIMRWIDEDYIQTSLSDYNAYLKEHPFEVVYKLKYPIEYDLTPEQIKTLKGLNNIWADTNGSVDVKYWTH